MSDHKPDQAALFKYSKQDSKACQVRSKFILRSIGFTLKEGLEGLLPQSSPKLQGQIRPG